MHLHSTCPACGARLPVSAAFCPSCGVAISGDAIPLEHVELEGADEAGGDVDLGAGAGRHRSWRTAAAGLGAVVAVIAGLILFGRSDEHTAAPTATTAPSDTTTSATAAASTTISLSPTTTTPGADPRDRPLSTVVAAVAGPLVGGPTGIDLYVAATGNDGNAPGLYRIDLDAGVVTLLAERQWTDRIVHLYGVPYGAVVAGTSIDVVTRVGVSFSSGVVAGDVVAPDPDGVHVWTTSDSDPRLLLRLRVDGGGTERTVQLPDGVRFAGLGADGAPLVRGQVGGTFRVDPDSRAVTRVSDGVVLGDGPAGLVELVCDDALACRQQLRPRDEGDPVLLAEGELALRGRAVQSPDGRFALFLVSRALDGGTPVSLIDLATGESRGIRTEPNLAVQLAPVDLATDGSSTPSSGVSWSPDGGWVTFVAAGRLYAWSVAQPEPTLVEGVTDALGAVLAIAPACAQSCG